MFDVLFRGGTVVDGSGRATVVQDVGVTGGTITGVGNLGRHLALRTINASGLVLCPGFIDAHSHADASVLSLDCDDSKVRQGVCTEVIGNCGDSLAPVNPRTLDAFARHCEPTFGGLSIEWSWRTLGQYCDAVKQHGSATNIVPLVGHGTIRAAVMGFSDRPATSAELQEMKNLVARSMSDGAFGLSTGLIYPPGCYANTAELVELATVVSEHGGIYATHMRNEARNLLTAVDEAIQIGREARIPVQISHCKVAGMPNWGKSGEFMARLGSARSRGIDVTGDQYPYLAGSTDLGSLLPHWTHEGGIDRLLSRLQDTAARSRILDELRGADSTSDSVLSEADFGDILLVYCPGHPEWEGRRLAEVASRQPADPYDTLLNVLLETEADAMMVRFMMSDNDLVSILQKPWIMVGSDSAPHPGKPHPRTYGTFPRVLGRYARDEGLLTLAEAVRKMTMLPASRFGLQDRGRIAEGFAADITVFDLETIMDTATYEDPLQYPLGVYYVMVNGVLAVSDGRTTGALSGRLLRNSNQFGQLDYPNNHHHDVPLFFPSGAML